ncbi:MAG: secretin N-terminal domain-containing protein [Candidatus Xenobia bacterium]
MLRLAAVLLALTIAAPAQAKSPLVTGLQVSENHGKLKILVSSTDQVQYKVINVTDPKNALVVEVFPAQLSTDVKKAVSVNKGVVDNIRVGQFSSNPDVVRLVVDLKQPAKYVIVQNPDKRGLTLSLVDTNFASAQAPTAGADLDKPEHPVAVVKHPAKPVTVAYQPVPKKKVVYAPPVRTVSLDFVNADLIYVLKILAKEMNMNLVTDQTVKGSVTMTLKDVPAEGALKLILKLSGFEYKVIDHTILVGSADTVNKIPNDIFQVQQPVQQHHKPTGPSTTLVIPLEFAKAADAQSSIQSNFPELTVSQVPGQNMLMVKGPKEDVLGAKSLASSLDRPPPPPPPAPEVQVVRVNYHEAAQLLQILKPMFTDLAFNLDTQLNAFIVSGNPESIQALKDMLAKIDLPLQQVMLEVKVVDLTEAGQKTLGFTHGTTTPGTFTTTFSESTDPVTGQQAAAQGAIGLVQNSLNVNFFTRTPFSITTTLSMLISQNDAVVVAQPRVVTQSGKDATILIGNKFPIVFFDPRAGQFQVQYVDIGVKLQVKPVVASDGYILMDIKPDVSQFVALINNQFPETATRQAQLSCRVKDGNTVVLGGLLTESETSTVQKIPFLGDLPVLGNFFKQLAKQRSKNEVVIMVTPKVIND